MSRRIEVEPGDRYGRLTILEELPSKRHPNGRLRRMMRCHCVCGTEVKVTLDHLRTGHSTSCGCYQKQTRTTHGHYSNGIQSPTYVSWHHMSQRCFNTNDNAYHYYGGRGITVCGGLRTFEGFFAHLGERPPGTSIDRINVDGNYSCGACPDCAINGWPNNVRWADRLTQAGNKRNSKQREEEPALAA